MKKMDNEMKNITTIIAEILRVPVTEITEHTSMESNPLWDSLSHIEIIYALERKFAIEFSGDEIVEAISVNKIKDIVLKKTGECLET